MQRLFTPNRPVTSTGVLLAQVHRVEVGTHPREAIEAGGDDSGLGVDASTSPVPRDERNQEGEKEYHKGVKMLRQLSAAAVVMCRGVWKAAGLVWAQQSRDEATRLRLEERQRRVERARVAASAVSIARRWREVGRERQWLRREQKRGAIRGLQEVVDRAREAGYPRGTHGMRVFQQHTGAGRESCSGGEWSRGAE